jgi:hypothetical protein
LTYLASLSNEKQAQIPETFAKGEIFESYVRAYLFPKEQYRQVNKTHGYLANKDDFIEATKNPDYTFRSLKGKIFYVEAKYRSSYFRGALRWCKFYQLQRYKEIDKQMPVYIIIGKGSRPDDPEELFFLPLKEISGVNLKPAFLQRYKVPVKNCISEDQLT